MFFAVIMSISYEEDNNGISQKNISANKTR